MTRRFQFSLRGLAAAVAWAAVAMFIATSLARGTKQSMAIQIPAMVGCGLGAIACLVFNIRTSFIVATLILGLIAAIFVVSAIPKSV
ncbi:MAG TPA: hypothetical protein VGN42_02635 [Pirellulales bacterium]|nr:hypothetical protein [Pirellulales bacterium]